MKNNAKVVFLICNGLCCPPVRQRLWNWMRCGHSSVAKRTGCGFGSLCAVALVKSWRGGMARATRSVAKRCGTKSRPAIKQVCVTAVFTKAMGVLFLASNIAPAPNERDNQSPPKGYPAVQSDSAPERGPFGSQGTLLFQEASPAHPDLASFLCRLQRARRTEILQTLITLN